MNSLRTARISLWILIGIVVAGVAFISPIHLLNRKDDRGYAPLHYAAANGRATDIALALRKGANPNVRDSAGNTPLHLAAQSGSTAAVALLLRGGARVNAKNKNGDTPLAAALRRRGVRPPQPSTVYSSRTPVYEVPIRSSSSSYYSSMFDTEWDRKNQEIERLEQELEQQREQAEREQQRLREEQERQAEQARRQSDYEGRLQMYEQYGELVELLVAYGAK